MDGSTCAATVGAGRREGFSGAFSARVRRRTGIHHHIRASTIVRTAAATTSAVAAVSSAPTFNAAFTTNAVSAAVIVTIAVHGTVVIVAACADVWPDLILDGAVLKHAGAAVFVNGIVTIIAAVVDAAGAACAGVQPNQVQDGPGRPHAGRAISLPSTPVVGPQGWSYVGDRRHGAGIDVECA